MKTQFTFIKLALVVTLVCASALDARAVTIKTRVTGANNWSTAATWEKILSGTATFNNKAVTGTGTHFTTEVVVGDLLVADSTGAVEGTVASITDDTHLTLVANATPNNNNIAFGKEAVPTSSDDVQIGNTAFNAVTVTLDVSSATVNSLTWVGDNQANTLTHSSANALTVNNDVTVTAPSGGVTVSWNINAGAATVGGNVLLAANSTGNQNNRITKIVLTTGTLNIAGDLRYSLSVAGSTAASAVVDLSGGACSLNIAGNITFPTLSVGTLTPGTASIVNFNGTSTSPTIPIGVSSVTYANLNLNNTSASGATISAAITATLVTGNINVQSGTFSSGGFNVAMANTKSCSVSTGATLNLTGSTVLSGTGTFTLNSGGTLGIGSTAGIASSGATGNVQMTTRNYSTGGNYTYIGTAAQVTGGGLPGTVNNLTINNSSGVTLSGSASVSGTLTLTSGGFAVGANTLTLNGPPIAGTPSNLSTTASSSLTLGGNASGVTIPSSVTTLNNLTNNNTTAAVTLSGGIVININITLASGAQLSLPSSTTSTCMSLWFGGLPQLVGSWGSTSSSATHTDNTHFAGTGLLKAGVVVGGVFGQSAPTITPSGGTNFVKFYGVPGYTYIIQRATSLSPSTNWVDYATIVNSTGLTNYADPSPNNPSFYRLKWVP